VRDAATSCSPIRTVWVIPVPLARRAFLRSSSGTSTVILRAVPIVPHHTILKTSTEYGISYAPSCDDLTEGSALLESSYGRRPTQEGASTEPENHEGGGARVLKGVTVYPSELDLEIFGLEESCPGSQNREEWLPFVDTYRTFSLAPDTQAKQLLLAVGPFTSQQVRGFHVAQ
jgi:hypothetical protein